jgi:hypothetical protein
MVNSQCTNGSGSFKMLEEFISMKNGCYHEKGDIVYMHQKISIKSKEERLWLQLVESP